MCVCPSSCHRHLDSESVIISANRRAEGFAVEDPRFTYSWRRRHAPCITPFRGPAAAARSHPPHSRKFFCRLKRTHRGQYELKHLIWPFSSSAVPTSLSLPNSPKYMGPQLYIPSSSSNRTLSQKPAGAPKRHEKPFPLISSATVQLLL